MRLSKVVKSDISEALTSGNAQVFKTIACPICGEEKAKLTFEKLPKEETGTEGGGYLLAADFECGHPQVAWVFADDGENATMGRVEMPPQEFVLPKMS